MSKRKRTYRCYACNAFYTNETGRTNADGTFTIGGGNSTRAVIVGTNRVHNCKPADKITGETATVYTPQNHHTGNPFTPPIVAPEIDIDDIETGANAIESVHSEPILPEHDVVPDTVSPADVLDSHVAETAKGKLDAAGKAIYELIEPAIDARIDAIAERIKQNGKTVNHRIEIITGAHTVTSLDNAHRQTEMLLRMAAIRVGREQSHLNVMLVGPAGTGKTTVAGVVAKTLGRKFFAISVGPQSTKTDFFGYTDAVGRPIWTVIRDAYVNGGVLLIDEMDSATAGALTYLNAILANDVCYFPAGAAEIESGEHTVKCMKHHDFFAIAGTNTHGKGNDAMYNARVKLDAATLDRFVGINWQYDTDMERREYAHHFSANALEPDFDGIDTAEHVASRLPWGDFIWRLRRAQINKNLRLVYGTRKLIYGAAMLDSGLFTRSETEAAVTFFGVSPDERVKLLADIAEQGGI